MVRALLIFGVALLAASMSYAQNSTPTDQTEQVRVLLERVQQLEKRVTEWRRGRHSLKRLPFPRRMSPGRSNYPRRNRRKHRLRRTRPGQHQHEMQEQAATVQQMETHYPSLQIRGFGDVDFRQLT